MSNPLQDKTHEAPTTTQRQRCYAARDQYYQCMDEYRDSNDGQTNCHKLKELYESNCLPSWVKYFERKRTFDLYKKKLNEEGFQEKDS